MDSATQKINHRMFPKVSVLTTVYNREKYLEDCIKSVLNSTYQNWEMIIVDDQSHDRSVEIAQNYAQIDKRIKVFINEVNLGDYPNRNKAASLAKGQYLKYLDADDIIYPNGLEIMVDSMDSFPSAALGISQKVVEDVKPYPFLLSPKESYYREFVMRGVMGAPPTNTIIRKDIFEALGGFTGERYVGDTEFWFRIAQQHDILKIVPDLVFWREHENQEYKKGMVTNSYLVNNYRIVMQMLGSDLCPLEENERRLAINKYNHRLSRDLIRLLINQKSIIKVNQIRKSCNRSWLEVLKSAF
ncbi:glycosyltransferase family 2 protein [Winogradskyella aurantiaca]|uniref:glycosyltransferase family 2 protein n=1 Tax=Winogradskyella aurantiaca TaxID=2219558 RepID=UPI000E1D692B|nr:glycosyltransferase family 2 protein [Winogradskyella aurantiaca]